MKSLLYSFAWKQGTSQVTLKRLIIGVYYSLMINLNFTNYLLILKAKGTSSEYTTLTQHVHCLNKNDTMSGGAMTQRKM